jgi:hypothetical protein
LREADRGARAALLVFIWTVVAGPGLHLVGHRDDHVHDARGTVPVAPGQAGPRHRGHQHGGLWHVHGEPIAALSRPAPAIEPLAPAAPPASSAPRPAPGGGHGTHAPEHFGLALIVSAPPLLPPPPARLQELEPSAPPGAPVLGVQRSPRTCRGPPPA